MPLAAPTELEKAVQHLTNHDKILAPVIGRAGPAQLAAHTDYYGALVNSIIGQQLSVKAAAAIKQRFRELFGGKLPAPREILSKSAADLRSVGFSQNKANYVRDLAQHIVDGKVHFTDIDERTNEEIIAELTDVKGIGEWTVHMFLIFCMGRLDVLPTGDLGIRNGIRVLYGFDVAPTPQQVIAIAEQHHWHPYESVASWYVWRSLDESFKTI
jgi:DNA-3-methyladenine glycosylase II